MAVADEVLRLDAAPDAVPRARRWVHELLAASDRAELVDDAELVVSELVTNALLHGRPPVVVRVHANGGVRIEVADGSRAAPVPAVARADAMTGRGLALVTALSSDWGVEQRPDGKVVWSEIAGGDGEPEAETDVDALLAAWDLDEDEPRDVRYAVALEDVPTDLLLAARAHVDNLVREFTLAQAAPPGHAGTLTPELTQLIECVATKFVEPRHAIRRQAADAAARGAARTTLTFELPLDAADEAETFLDALDDIDAYARAARLLTLETPPQHRVFRHWYLGAIVGMVRAAAAGEQFTPETFQSRLLREVGAVEVARRAADRAARLQTVTAGLVGATTAEEVGAVVVSEGVAALGASAGGLILVGDDDRLDVRASIGYPERLIARLRAESRAAPLPTAVAMRTGEPVWLESREERDERYPELADLEPATVSMCSVPLLGVDRVIGALRFTFEAQKLFDADERRFILTLAAQTAQALERAAAADAARVANEKLAFLAQASAALAESLDYRTTLGNVTRLAVPRLADWCVIHIAEDDAIPAIAVAHSDPEQVAYATDFQRRFPIDPDATHGVAHAIRTGTSELLPVVPVASYEAVARDDEHLAALLRLGITSAIVVPLSARGRIFGALSMYYAESGRRYDASDLVLAEDLAHRAALAIDNAFLFRALSDRA